MGDSRKKYVPETRLKSRGGRAGVDQVLLDALIVEHERVRGGGGRADLEPSSDFLDYIK